MENPRSRHYAAGLTARSAPLVRGSSRRITIMRFRPANIRVINRRNSLSIATDAAFTEPDENTQKVAEFDKVVPYQWPSSVPRQFARPPRRFA
jgi:hypothetical protein